MKRTLCFVLCTAMLFSLCACANAPADSESPEISFSVQDGDSSLSLSEEAPGSSVVTGLLEDNKTYEDNGKTVMTSKIQYEVFTSETASAAVQTAINTKISDKVQNLRANADEMSKQAISDNTAGSMTETYFANYTLSVGFNSDKYGVYTVEEQVYYGGMHPSETLSAMNFSLENGEILSFADIFSQDSSVYIPRLQSEVRKQIEAQIASAAEGESIYYENYNDGLSSSAFDDRWYFSSEGLCLIYEPYEIAPYASGVLCFTIPYENIADLLKDKEIV